MKIQFMGSVPTFPRAEERELSDQEKPFAQACQEMGYVAASRQHTILLSDDHPASADYHIFHGALRYAGEAQEKLIRIEVNRPEGSRLIFDSSPGNVRIDYRFHPDYEHVMHGTLLPNLAALESSDVLVTVGGGLTVKLMGQIAADKEKPVLAIPSFGGTSVELYEIMRYNYKNSLKDRIHDLALLKTPWRQGFAEKALDLAEALKQPRRVETPHSYFLSYVWEDSEFADHVEVLFHRCRRVINRDESIFRAGVDLSDVVKSFINESDTFIGLWNARYQQSLWCPHELAYARNRQAQGLKPTRVVLLMLDETEPPIQFFNLLRLNGKNREQRENSIRKVIAEEK